MEDAARHVRLHRVRPLQRRVPGARDGQAPQADEGRSATSRSTCSTETASTSCASGTRRAGSCRRRPRRRRSSSGRRRSSRRPRSTASKPGAVRADGAYCDVEGQVHVDEIWACTTCAGCVQACPVLIDSVPGSLLAMRQSLVMMESDFPAEATTAFKGMEVQGNPWSVGQDRRLEWAEGLDVPVMAELGREVEYLFWVGCAGATDPRARKTTQALARILKAAKVDFAVLGREEKCTGDPARRMGNEYLFQQLAQENIETLKQYKFKKIVVTCPHCLNSLGNDYRELGASYDGRPPHAAALRADGPGPRAARRGEGRRRPRHVPRPVLSRPLQRRLRAAARGAREARREEGRDGEQPRRRASAAAPAAAGSSSRRRSASA